MAGDDPLDALHGKADAILNLQRNNADRLDKLETAPPETPPLKATDREPLHVIQARLREETAAGVQAGRVRRGRQM